MLIRIRHTHSWVFVNQTNYCIFIITRENERETEKLKFSFFFEPRGKKRSSLFTRRDKLTLERRKRKAKKGPVPHTHFLSHTLSLTRTRSLSPSFSFPFSLFQALHTLFVIGGHSTNFLGSLFVEFFSPFIPVFVRPKLKPLATPHNVSPKSVKKGNSFLVC